MAQSPEGARTQNMTRKSQNSTQKCIGYCSNHLRVARDWQLLQLIEGGISIQLVKNDFGQYIDTGNYSVKDLQNDKRPSLNQNWLMRIAVFRRPFNLEFLIAETSLQSFMKIRAVQYPARKSDEYRFQALLVKRMNIFLTICSLLNTLLSSDFFDYRWFKLFSEQNDGVYCNSQPMWTSRLPGLYQSKVQISCIYVVLTCAVNCAMIFDVPDRSERYCVVIKHSPSNCNKLPFFCLLMTN